MMRRSVWGGLILLLSACATVPDTENRGSTMDFDTLHQLFEDHHVRDARFRQVNGKRYLQVNLALRSRIEGYGEQIGLERKRDYVGAYLRSAQPLGDRVVALLLERLSPGALRDFIDHHPVPGDGVVQGKGGLLAAYRAYSSERLDHDLSLLDAASSEQAVDDFWNTLVADIEESILTKGRLTRMLLTAPAVPLVKWWIAHHETTDYRGSASPHFKQQRAYYPAMAEQTPVQVTQADWLLLQRYAPVIVQGSEPQAPYPTAMDQFGTISLTGKNPEEAVPVVDVARPAVYAYVDTKPIQGAMVKQLVYTLWHPAHPKLHALDPEAGRIDGWTLRVTLNRKNEPLLFESVSNCGCYYKVFPTEELENASRAAFHQKLAGKNFYVENHLEDNYDAVVPELVSGIAGAAQGPVLYYSAGRHELVTIRSAGQLGDDEKANGASYTLRPYDELESLPLNGYHASLFGEDGLVRNAHRLEGRLLMASGLYHAGHPRQRETQMIYFDEARFDDPGLLETYLRLPPPVSEDVLWSKNP